MSKNIIIVDDMVDTAGTLTSASNMLIKEGAISVRAFCTHPVLSGSAYEKIKNHSYYYHTPHRQTRL